MSYRVLVVLTLCSMWSSVIMAEEDSRVAPEPMAACVHSAATRYGLPPRLIMALLRVEGGRVGAVSKNSNASYDIGPMQINSIHLPRLAKLGIDADSLRNDGCINIHVGAWILRREIAGAPDVWTGIGRYHSRTPELNAKYQVKVWRALERIAVDVSSDGVAVNTRGQ